MSEMSGASSSALSLSRRCFVAGAVATAASAIGTNASAQAAQGGGKTEKGEASKQPKPAAPNLAATPPAGFVPMKAPGLVVKVTGTNTLQPNQLWPTDQAAKQMLERAMTELTGQSDMGKAFGKFVHPKDRVAIKLNGIAAQKGATMATNKELVLEIVKGVLAAGVAPENLWLLEQYPTFLTGTRAKDDVLPEGVKGYTHNNTDATPTEVRVHGIPTKFARKLIEATAVINVALIKDHALSGYTGLMKNMTHGVTMNPHLFHANLMDPQIPLLFAQDAIRSRMRLQITDAFKVIFNGGPLDRDPRSRVPYESVFVGTDPVALDAVGWKVLDQLRQEHGLPTLAKAKREPTYIHRAQDIGLGIADVNRIRVKESRI